MSKLKAALADTSLFRRFYIICLFLCNVSFVQIAAYVALVFLFIWGVFLVVRNEIVSHTILKTRYGVWLLAFIVLTTVTALIHITDNFLYNMVIELHFAICFFIFYAVHTEKRLNFRRELYSVCRFIVCCSTVIAIIGLACLMAGIQFEVLWIKFIVYENRFTGLYTNPNILGFVSVVAVFCCHMLTKQDFITISGKERVSRIWIGACLIMSLFSLLLCDSNGSLVLMIGYVIFYLIYKMFGAERKLTTRQIIVKALSLALVGAFVVTSAVFVRQIFQKGFSDFLASSHVTVEKETDENGEEIFLATSRITFTHENKNFGSGRLRLWRQAASLFSDFPIFGIGKGNVYRYGEDKFDNGIAFSHLYGDWLAKYSTDFHNGYAMLLVCSGVTGFVIFSIFGLRFIKHITPHVFRRDDLKESILPCMYSFLFAYLIYAFIEKALLYDISFMVLFFWLILGYTSCYLVRYEPEHRSFYVFNKRLRRSLL